MHLMDSVLQLLQLLREAYDSYTYACKQQGIVSVRFQELPHELITFLLFSIRFEKSSQLDLKFLFLEFIRLGYNPFRSGATYKERIMIKSVIEIIDKSNGYKRENKKKNQ